MTASAAETGKIRLAVCPRNIADMFMTSLIAGKCSGKMQQLASRSSGILQSRQESEARSFNRSFVHSFVRTALVVWCVRLLGFWRCLVPLVRRAVLCEHGVQNVACARKYECRRVMHCVAAIEIRLSTLWLNARWASILLVRSTRIRYS